MPYSNRNEEVKYYNDKVEELQAAIRDMGRQLTRIDQELHTLRARVMDLEQLML